MKFFSRVETKTNKTNEDGASRRWKSTLVVALAAFSCVGCVGRKQYAINEAILISERRQLEDEIYRLQFELRDALEENERLRQEAGGAASVPASRTRAGAGATDAFFPGLDASQTLTTGGLRKVETSAATAEVAPRTTAPVLRTDGAENAPTTEGAVETLPDYVPIPVSSKQPVRTSRTSQSARRSQTAQSVQNAWSRQTAPIAQTVQNAQDVATAPQTAGKTFGVRRDVVVASGEKSETRVEPVVPVAASTASAAKNENVVSSVFVDSAQGGKKATTATGTRTDGAAWSPLAR